MTPPSAPRPVAEMFTVSWPPASTMADENDRVALWPTVAPSTVTDDVPATAWSVRPKSLAVPEKA